jgi:Tfp pilus assembly protein PilO
MKKQKKPLSKKTQIILIAVGGLLVLVLGYMVVVKPQGAKAKALQKEAADTQAQIAQLQAAVAEQKRKPVIRAADIYRLAKAMPDSSQTVDGTDMPDILLELNQIARQAGITLKSIAPAGLKPWTGYGEVPITLSFDANFYSLSDMLFRLRTLVSVHDGELRAYGRLFSITHIGLGGPGEKGYPEVAVDVAISAFVYGQNLPASGPAVPEAPTTSGTTGTTSTPASTDAATTAPTTTTPSASGNATAAGAP